MSEEIAVSTDWQNLLATMTKMVGGGQAPEVSLSAKDDVISKKIKPIAPDDSQLANRWLDENPDMVWGQGEWRLYANGIYERREDDAVRFSIKSVMDNARYEGVKPSKFVLNSIAELARLERVVPADKWDSNLDYIVFRNGAYNISTDTLESHRRDLYATSLVDCDFDRQASGDYFDRIVRERLGDEKAEFLQEFAGLCFTPDTRHEIALWLVGARGAGKSTIINAIKDTLGKRAGTLSLSDIERSQFGLNNIQGRTLLTSTEQPKEKYIRATDVINRLISGEWQRIEHKHKDAYDIKPIAKILWSMNTTPKVTDSADGIFRRIKIVTFPALPAAQIDVDLKERLEHEKSGIVNWCIEGLFRLRARGKFLIPKAVAADTDAYLNECDYAKHFLLDSGAVIVTDERRLDKEFAIQAQMLYDKYYDYMKRNGHIPVGSNLMAREWERLGLVRGDRGAGGYVWHGITFDPVLVAKIKADKTVSV